MTPITIEQAKDKTKMSNTDPNKDKTAARKIWDSRNPQHETNADTGEDMFYATMELCMTEFAATEAQQFAEWVENKYQRFVIYWILRNNPNGGLIAEQRYYTTTELYNLYLDEKKP